MFRLPENFIESYKNREVPWGEVGYVVYKRTYARRLPEGGTEEWWQTCRRVIEGMFEMQRKHCVSLSLPWSDEKALETATDAYERLFILKWTPPGRGLWMAGTSFVEQRTGAALFNCGFRSTKDLATRGGHIFEWIMDSLMLGIGVGFDTLGAGSLIIKNPSYHGSYHIPDTREGWTASTRMILEGFFFGTPIPMFSYELIREAGKPINGFGGTSSGAGPLIELHEALIEMYSKCIGQPITSVNIVDTENLIGRCVVAGNVRRSAALALGNPDDQNFIHMKNPTLFPNELSHHRWGSNNSINACVGMDYTEFAELCVKNGEPGFIWLDQARTHGRFKDPIRNDDLKVAGFNPCSEQQLEDAELCCLVETYLWLHDSFEDWLKTLKIAYLYAKTVTLAKTNWPETNAIMLKNRRIGLSISGFEQACNKFGQNTMLTWCDSAYSYIQHLDSVYSDWLCIPRSKRTTSIKPGGTTPLLNGSTPGEHWPIGEYLIRRIVFADTDPLVDQLQASGYYIEKSNYYPNSVVVEFPIRTKYFVRAEKDVSMWEQLERTAQLQYYWADNSVSVTIKFNEHEAKQIKYALQIYDTRLKAVSFLPHKTKHYTQMPFECITKEEYITKTQGLVPLTRAIALEGIGEKFCDTDSCTIK